LNIEPPETFDYESYDYDWCRYCGARYSSNFTKGPWGSRTLCTIHYIDWNQKKVLNLTSFKDIPKKPIKVEVNTELSYLQKMVSKNDKDKEALNQMLENLRPTKKVRRAENEPNQANLLDKDDLVKEEDVVPKEEDNEMMIESNHSKGKHHHPHNHLHSTPHPNTHYNSHQNDIKAEPNMEEAV